MKPLAYTFRQKKRASTLMALGQSECEASDKLIAEGYYREAIVHLYFTCYYVSQAVLCHKVKSSPTHRNLNTQMHKAYGRHKTFPRRYVDLHTELYNQRTTYDYKTTHTPDPDVLEIQLRKLKAYVKLALRVVPRIEIFDLLTGFHADNENTIKDISFDIYCPKTYAHHTRLTFWQPPFYLEIFGVSDLSRNTRRMLKALKVKRTEDYVVGLNSKVNQYKDDHFLMIDIDAVNPSVEAALKPIGGILLRTGRGFHFIGKRIIQGRREWQKAMRGLLRDKELKKHVDKDHVEISLRRGYATLRVTSSPVKTTVPFFYKEI